MTCCIVKLLKTELDYDRCKLGKLMPDGADTHYFGKVGDVSSNF